jgi:hypothetical protein
VDRAPCNQLVLATIFGELPRRRKQWFLRLSHQAFRKHRLLLPRCSVQSFVEVVVVPARSSSRVPVEYAFPTFPCHRCQREVVSVASVVVESGVVVAVLARNSVAP